VDVLACPDGQVFDEAVTAGNPPSTRGVSVCVAAAEDPKPSIPRYTQDFPLFTIAPSAPKAVALRGAMYSLQGQKSSFPGWPNQDTPMILTLSSGMLLAGVFDGHGRFGHLVSQRVRHLVQVHSQHLTALSQPQLPQAFSWLFKYIQDTLQREGMAQFSGTTATLALVDCVRGTATVAHVGDSTLMISRNGEIDFVSTDHKVDDDVERRVVACGGEVRTQTVSNVTARRVFARGQPLPGLAMARALGDVEAHNLGVHCEPQIVTIPIMAGSTIVIASDGLWDELPHTQVAQHVASTPGRDATNELARSLVVDARRQYHDRPNIDDITAVVVQATEW